MKYLQTTTVLERGILTSTYKQEIKRAILTEKCKSISKIKGLILNHQNNVESKAAVILQVSLFIITIVMISF
ncbi:hypothetical protein SHK09_07105 [Polaribacter sp. PL03]|uniref:hypothetical protein n=1 Tax=Polaribacter sp. PL03 TaxID=3088353 RepID=UPI0029D12530|nr:hypothetical protein [Polaribacter sp. PL03]MDX6746554.1 hypothetical protein [Polaribacter sp. PL03]